jgi:hypothetical protein
MYTGQLTGDLQETGLVKDSNPCDIIFDMIMEAEQSCLFFTPEKLIL